MNKNLQIPKSPQSGLAVIAEEKFDVMTAVGGWRGIVESTLPTVIFLVLYIVSGQPLLPALIACGICLIEVVVRLVQRIPVTPVLGGLFAVVLSVALVWYTGKAANMFIWGILLNAIYLAVLAISVVVRWPLLGVFISFLRGESNSWQQRPELSILRRRYYQITWIWIALFSLRLLVQLPLYFANAAEALGIAKLVLGIPLFALAIWFSWLLARSAPVGEMRSGSGRNAEN